MNSRVPGKLILIALAVCIPTWLQADETPKLSPDVRLDKKVTLQGIQLRLFQIAAELTKQTSVTVRTGKNEQDWPIRDIPITLSVKDVPLGKMLDALAQVSHTTLFVEGVKTDKGEIRRIYRLNRDIKTRQAVDTYAEKARQKSIERASMAWDTMVKLADTPASQWKDNGKGNEWEVPMPMAQMMAKLFASLDPSMKDKVLAGESVTLTPRITPIPSS